MALSTEQKISVIQQRLQQFESELYLHQLNKATFEALNISTDETNANIAQLETAIAVHEQQLTELSS